VSDVSRSGAEPIRPRLLGNVPNPFGLATQIRFRLAEPSLVTLHIYDLQGREVRGPAGREQFPAGESAVWWDGRDDAGREVPAGVYLVRVSTRTGESTSKLILTR
jgi:flagellar hook assembly protein FlgD